VIPSWSVRRTSWSYVVSCARTMTPSATRQRASKRRRADGPGSADSSRGYRTVERAASTGSRSRKSSRTPAALRAIKLRRTSCSGSGPRWRPRASHTVLGTIVEELLFLVMEPFCGRSRPDQYGPYRSTRRTPPPARGADHAQTSRTPQRTDLKTFAGPYRTSRFVADGEFPRPGDLSRGTSRYTRACRQHAQRPGPDPGVRSGPGYHGAPVHPSSGSRRRITRLVPRDHGVCVKSVG
jgi:hypothetical protein